MKSNAFSVVVQKKYNPCLHLQKMICWPKEDRLIKKWEPQNEKMLARKRTERSNAIQLNPIMHSDLNSCLAVREGPCYICTVCNRLLYRKTVTELKKGKYNIQHIFTGKHSFDNKEYICNTCSSKLL